MFFPIPRGVNEPDDADSTSTAPEENEVIAKRDASHTSTNPLVQCPDAWSQCDPIKEIVKFSQPSNRNVHGSSSLGDTLCDHVNVVTGVACVSHH
jgi:hypothetical protein